MTVLVDGGRRRFLARAGSLAAAALAAPMVVRAQDRLKVGFVYYGPVGDYGWTFAHDQGRRQLVAAFGDAVETQFVENVPEDATAGRIMRELVQQGHQLIFSTSFGFMNETVKSALENPDVKFEHASGIQRAHNLATYNLRFHEGRAVMGTLAGYMAESGIAGYIASFPIPEVVMGINAFTIAARRVNPSFVTRVVWLNSWFDPQREGDAARSFIDQGVDVLCQHTDSTAVLEAAEEAGVYGFGQSADMSAFAPRAHLSGIVNNWGPYYIDRVQALRDGRWMAGDTWAGLRDDMVGIAPFHPDVPGQVAAAANNVRDRLIDGSFDLWAGPIRDEGGLEKVGMGGTLNDSQLLTMNWFVEGVQS